MSGTVDNRVVNMQFNNAQFEKGVSTSIKSLDALKKGLNLEESARSLSNLDKVGKSFSLAGIADGVDAISNKFTTLGIMGVTALANITTSAMNAGAQLVKSLTIDPIMMGLDEYETKMNAITTILTNTKSKGTTLEDVNKALAELNEYADQTIYNFAEMTRNIGTFTAAGVDLKTATASIKGIANLAAGSGSSALQASTAMYQLSQAIAAGSVKLIDWNSVVNAGMGGELFQNALRTTAKEMGIVVDAGKPFRETLEQGWLTSEVLTKTLSKFANDADLIKAATQVTTFTKLLDTMKESVQSGWAVTWENIIGNKEQSATTLTAINNSFSAMIGPMTDARNAALAFWNANGGRDAVIQALSSAFNGLASILKPIGLAFREVFPPTTGQRLIDISVGFRDLMANFKIGEETANNLKNTFKGLFALLDIGKMAVTALAKGFFGIVSAFLPVGDGILYCTGGIGNFIVAIDQAIKSSDMFNVVIENIGKVIKPLADGLKSFVDVIVGAFKAVGNPDLSGIDTFAEHVEARFEPLSALGTFLQKLFTIFYNLAKSIGDIFGRLRDAIMESLNASNFNEIIDLINSGLFAAILYGIKKFINSLTGITDGVGGFLENITGIFDGVRGCLVAYQNSLKANILMKIAISIGILAAALLTISMIDSAKLTSSLGAMTAMFIELFAAMTVMTGVMGKAGILSIFSVTTGMILLSTAVFILANAMNKLSTLDWGQITRGLVAVGGLMGLLVGASKLISFSSKGLITGSMGLVIFAVAIYALTASVKKLGDMDPKNLAKGLVGVGVLLGEIALFLKATDLSGMGAIKSVGILIMAASLVVLAKAVEKLGNLDIKQLGKGLLGIGVVLGEIAMFMRLSGDAKGVMATAAALAVLSGSIYILALAIGKMGAMPWDQMGRGLITLGAALGMITLMFTLLPKNIFIQSLALLDVAGAMIMLAQALEKLGALSWDEVARALVAMGVSLGIIIGAFVLLGKTSSLADSLAFTVLILGVTMLAGALKTLGSMSLTQIGAALLALAGAFTVVGVAAALMTPVIPQMLALAGAIALLGLGVAAIGAGMLAFATGLASLAVAGGAGVTVLIAAVTGVAGTIPYVAQTLAQGFIQFVQIIGDGAPLIAEAFKQIILSFIDVVLTVIPNIVNAFMTLMLKILETVLQYLPQLIDTGMKVILAFLDGIARNITAVTESAVNVMIKFIEGITSKLPDLIDAGFKLMISFLNGLATAIENNTPTVLAAVANLLIAILKGIGNCFGRFVEAGSNLIDGFIEGIKSKISEAAEWAANLAKSALDAAKEALDINSPSRAFMSLGQSSSEGFALGINKYATIVAKSASNLGNTAISSLNQTIGKISEAINTDVDLSPTIRPVIDMNNVEAGLKSSFDKKRTINVDNVESKTATIANAKARSTSEERGGDTTDNSDNSTIKIYQYNTVRDDTDIKKINQGLSNLVNKKRSARGVLT